MRKAYGMSSAPKCKALGCSRRTRRSNGYCFQHKDMKQDKSSTPAGRYCIHGRSEKQQCAECNKLNAPKSASRSDETKSLLILPDYVREAVVEIEKKLDSSLPLPSVASDMTVSDYDLYIQMAQVFGLLAKTALAATRNTPVSERGTLSAVKQFVRGWMHECPTDLPTVKRLCELNALFERNSYGG